MLVVDDTLSSAGEGDVTYRREAVVDPAGPPKHVGEGRGARIWLAVWPKVAAIGLALLAWQCVVWSGWRPEYVLPGPVAVFRELGSLTADGIITDALWITLQRAAKGFAVALGIGVIIGGLVTSSRTVRSAVGSMITGLQTMPSIAWSPCRSCCSSRARERSCSSSCSARHRRSPTA